MEELKLEEMKNGGDKDEKLGLKERDEKWKRKRIGSEVRKKRIKSRRLRIEN